MKLTIHILFLTLIGFAQSEEATPETTEYSIDTFRDQFWRGRVFREEYHYQQEIKFIYLEDAKEDNFLLEFHYCAVICSGQPKVTTKRCMITQDKTNPLVFNYLCSNYNHAWQDFYRDQPTAGVFEFKGPNQITHKDASGGIDNLKRISEPKLIEF